MCLCVGVEPLIIVLVADPRLGNTHCDLTNSILYIYLQSDVLLKSLIGVINNFLASLKFIYFVLLIFI